ncbi:MAG: hypothetical protein RI957_851 [Verrucomicrobiota bacterium]|jgi:fermentation-respiration switch protein FrsA (DUF1100 family)
MKSWFLTLFLGAPLPLVAQGMAPDLANLLDALKQDQDGQLSRMAQMMLGPNGGNKLFYFPTKDTPATPENKGLAFSDVSFTTSDDVKLHGWFLPVAKGQAVKGTVVFSHGNAGSIGHHLGFVDWLPRNGYQLLMYDYRGFGKSAGAPSREGLIRDAESAFAYAVSRADVANGKIYSLGHSMGGAKSIAALTRAKVPGLRAAITDGTFASYEEMAEIMAGNFGKNLVSDEFAPRSMVTKLSVPLLVVHGSEDEVVPLSQGKSLFAAARESKTFFEVKGGRHGDSLARNNGEYRKKMLAWMERF